MSLRCSSHQSASRLSFLPIAALWFFLLGPCSSVAQTMPSFGNFGGAPRAQSDHPPQFPYDPAIKVRWFPIQASFAPDGSWLVVNLCNFYNPYYCRLVRWEPAGPTQALHDGLASSGRWRLIAGQHPDKSYLWPMVSWDGKKLAFTVADCDARRQEGWLPPTSIPAAPPISCAIFSARPATSMDTDDISVGYRELPIPTAARPSWRPDDKAIIYWRMLGQARLASGRMTGLRSLYEYDLEREREEAKLDSRHKLSWVYEFNAAHYAPDGTSFSACAYSTSKAATELLPGGILCFEVAARNPAHLEVLNGRGEGAFDMLYAEWRGSHRLIEWDKQLFLVDKSDPRRDGPVFDARGTVGTITSAAISARNGDIVVIRGTLWRGMEPSRAGTLGFFSKPSSIHPAHPILTYITRSTGQAAPTYWPNIELLD